MKRLNPGEQIVLSWPQGAVDCRVIAAAGRYVLLRPRQPVGADVAGPSSLTYLDGMVPMGWDGTTDVSGADGELRFCVSEAEKPADRRSSVRIPVMAGVAATAVDGSVVHGHLLDVSAGGLRFRHPGRLPSGSLLRVRSAVVAGLTIDADAIVRLSEPGVSAVEFTAYHGATRQEIGRWTVSVLRAHLNSG